MSARRFTVEPGGRLRATLALPGDKSISHRALMLAAVAEGETQVEGFLASVDCRATQAAFEAMGVTYRESDAGMRVTGVGLYGLRRPPRPLDLGNSGTSMRLLAGLLAGQAFDSVLTGDASLSRRPMARIIEPLRAMGAAIDADAGDRAPLSIRGARPLRAIAYAPPVASAQVKSCVLFAGLYAQGATRIEEPGTSRDHSERMLTSFGVRIDRDGRRITMAGGQPLHSARITIPADLSSAAFFLVAASIAPDSELVLPGVGVNPTRRGVIDILLAMGADIVLRNQRETTGEPVADLVVRSAPLVGIDIGADQAALAIDEFPAIFIAAACAAGTTRVSGARELRVKESDRIAVMAAGLARLGIDVTIHPDGLDIVGRPAPAGLAAAHITSHGDHRVAMAFAIAGLRADGPIVIDDCDNVATSFPDFVATARAAGLDIVSRDTA